MEQYKQRLEFFLAFSAQDASFRTDLGTIFHCFWLSASNQPDPNQYRIDHNPEVRERKLRLFAYQTSDLFFFAADLVDHLVERAPLSPKWASFILTRGMAPRSSHGLCDLDLGPVERPPLWPDLVVLSQFKEEQKADNRTSELDLHKTDLEVSDPEAPKENLNNIFIRSMEGNTICIRIGSWEEIKTLKQRIQERTGIPPYKQILIYTGKILQEEHKLNKYGIGRDSTIYLSTRIRGGCPGTSSKGTVSFKDAVKGKKETQAHTDLQDTIPGPYIVEQTAQNPAITISAPEVNEIQQDYLSKAVICRFNGFWPKPKALRQWIYSIWTVNCDIHLCSKGFFIVKFDTVNDKEYALYEGPWFWGNAGLFLTPWFPEFDPNTMVVTKMPVWVKLYNLPLHFWHYKVLTDIGNTLGKFLKVDNDRLSKDIYTFSRICVEVDLSQGLPDHFLLLHNEKQWAQPLDYENTAFRYRICRQTGHLQSICPQNKKNKKRRQPPKPKGW